MNTPTLTFIIHLTNHQHKTNQTKWRCNDFVYETLPIFTISLRRPLRFSVFPLLPLPPFARPLSFHTFVSFPKNVPVFRVLDAFRPCRLLGSSCVLLCWSRTPGGVQEFRGRCASRAAFELLELPEALESSDAVVLVQDGLGASRLPWALPFQIVTYMICTCKQILATNKSIQIWRMVNKI